MIFVYKLQFSWQYSIPTSQLYSYWGFHDSSARTPPPTNHLKSSESTSQQTSKDSSESRFYTLKGIFLRHLLPELNKKAFSLAKYSKIHSTLQGIAAKNTWLHWSAESLIPNIKRLFLRDDRISKNRTTLTKEYRCKKNLSKKSV